MTAEMLPPLPEPDIPGLSGGFYSPMLTRRLIAAARAQALEEAARKVDAAIGEAIAGHFHKHAISALMQTRDMLRDGSLIDKDKQ